MIRPSVSVVIPSYNRERYICEAVESVLGQTEPAEEIIVVDDGSSDRSLSLLQNYGNAIRIIAQENAGVSAARNAGIAATQGDYVALLDSDDRWLPEKLAIQRDAAQSYPTAGLIYGLCNVIDENGAVVSYADERRAGLEPDALKRLMKNCYPTTSTYMIRRDALNEIDGFDSQYERGGGFASEDWELCLRLAEWGPFYGTGKTVAEYRIHSDSKTLGDRLPHTLGLIALRRQIDERMKEWRAGNPPLLDAGDQLAHQKEYAHVLGRLGLIYMRREEWEPAQEAFALAAKLEPHSLKHRLRWAAAAARRKGSFRRTKALK